QTHSCRAHYERALNTCATHPGKNCDCLPGAHWVHQDAGSSGQHPPDVRTLERPQLQARGRLDGHGPAACFDPELHGRPDAISELCGSPGLELRSDTEPVTEGPAQLLACC